VGDSWKSYWRKKGPWVREVEVERGFDIGREKGDGRRYMYDSG
jgi:hypothetical protein